MLWVEVRMISPEGALNLVLDGIPVRVDEPQLA